MINGRLTILFAIATIILSTPTIVDSARSVDRYVLTVFHTPDFQLSQIRFGAYTKPYMYININIYIYIDIYMYMYTGAFVFIGYQRELCPTTAQLHFQGFLQLRAPAIYSYVSHLLGSGHTVICL